MSTVFHDIKTVDITSISKDEVFAIDTNVLLWTHYAKASDPNLNRHPYQVFEYPDFVANLLQNKNKLVTTTLNISELIAVVEKSEYKIYKTTHSCNGIKFKDFRKINSARSSYKNEINTMMAEIRASYNDQIEVIEVTRERLEEFNKNIEQTQCDVFDYLIIEYLKSIGVTNYISDDKDFMSVEDIQLFSTYG